MYYYNNAAYLLGLHVVKSLKTLYPVALGEEYIFMFLFHFFLFQLFGLQSIFFKIYKYVPPCTFSQEKCACGIFGHVVAM